VAGIVDALAASGRLDHALIVYTSDNGLSLGEHRWIGKAAPWEETIRVPLVVRYDSLGAPGRADPHMVANVDLAPTFAAVAGTRAPGASGRSLTHLLSGSPAGWRTELQLESIGGGKGRLPAYCALRTEGLMFVAYASGDVALYDLKADPNELRNRAADPSLADRVRVFEAALRRVCRPPPPGSPPGFPP
jgi:arylsulfatase A-like enzyme